MTSKELKKLNRSELIELLLMQSREMDAMKEKMAALEEEVSSKRLKLADAGSIAEAALQITNIFSEAQKAADVYLENVRQAETASRSLEEKTREKCQAMERDARDRCQRLESKTNEKCGQMLRDAEKQSREAWNTVEQRLSDYVAEHQELKTLVQDCVEHIAPAERGADEKEKES